MSVLKNIHEELKKSFPGTNPVTYAYEENGGSLEKGWLLQTPRIWGQPTLNVQPWHRSGPGVDSDFGLLHCSGPCEGSCEPLNATVTRPGSQPRQLCLGHSDKFVDEVYNIMVKARHTIHITTLWSEPDGRFMAAMRNAIGYLARTGRLVNITLMMGYLITEVIGPDKVKKVLEDLVRGAREVSEGRITATVLLYGSALHWNHSKIIVVDGEHSLVGGHNWYFEKYLQHKPVFDLSMRLSGSISKQTVRFVEAAWKIARNMPRQERRDVAFYYSSGEEEIQNLDITEFEFPQPVQSTAPAITENGAYTVPVLAIGRLDEEFNKAAGDWALVCLIRAAKKNIKISQQNLGYFPKPITQWNAPVNDALADFLVKEKKDVFIVQTSENVGDYNSGQTIPQLIRDLFDRAKKRHPGTKDADLWDVLNQRLHIAPLRFSAADAWPGGHGIANHSKFIMIDDEVFYIGSQNLYPPGPVVIPVIPKPWRLKEFGYMIESKKAAQEIIEQYWGPLMLFFRPMEVALTTDKQKYKVNEQVRFHVVVKNKKPINDTIVAFRNSDGKELSFEWTHGETNGWLSATWKIPEWLKGETVSFRYCHEGGNGGMKVFITKTIITVES